MPVLVPLTARSERRSAGRRPRWRSGATALVLLLAVLVPATVSAPSARAVEATGTQPPCEKLDGGSQQGACGLESDAIQLAVTGELGDPGDEAVIQVTSSIPPCLTWSSYTDETSPDPCYTGWEMSRTRNGASREWSCDYIDGLNADRYSNRSCDTAPLYRSTGSSPDLTWHFDGDPASDGIGNCRLGANWQTYIYGGDATIFRFPPYAADHQRCVVEQRGPRPDGLHGATWIRANIHMTVWENGEYRTEEQTFWVPLRGDLDDRPFVSFSDVDEGDGQFSFVNRTFSLSGETITYEWDFGDDSVHSFADEPTHTYAEAGEYTVTLTARDDNDEVSTTERVDVKPPPLDVAIALADGETAEVGTPFDVVVTLTAGDSGLGGLTAVRPQDWDDHLDLTFYDDGVSLVSQPTITPFDLLKGEERTFTYSVLVDTPLSDDLYLESWWDYEDDSGKTRWGDNWTTIPVDSPKLSGEFFRVDGLGDEVREGDTAPVRLRVENLSEEDVTGLQLVSVGESGDAGLVDVRAATEPLAGQDAVLTLPDGLAASGPSSVGFSDFEVDGVEAGETGLVAVVKGTTAGGEEVTGTIEQDWLVRQNDLVTTITVDPEEYELLDEDAAGPPAPITVTVEIANQGSEPIRDVRLLSLDPRAQDETPVLDRIDVTDGPTDETPIEYGDIAAGESVCEAVRRRRPRRRALRLRLPRDRGRRGVRVGPFAWGGGCAACRYALQAGARARAGVRQRHPGRDGGGQGPARWEVPHHRHLHEPDLERAHRDHGCEARDDVQPGRGLPAHPGGRGPTGGSETEGLPDPPLGHRARRQQRDRDRCGARDRGRRRADRHRALAPARGHVGRRRDGGEGRAHRGRHQGEDRLGSVGRRGSRPPGGAGPVFADPTAADRCDGVEPLLLRRRRRHRQLDVRLDRRVRRGRSCCRHVLARPGDRRREAR